MSTHNSFYQIAKCHYSTITENDEPIKQYLNEHHRNGFKKGNIIKDSLQKISFS
jgi:hypothetical protein